MRAICYATLIGTLLTCSVCYGDTFSLELPAKVPKASAEPSTPPLNAPSSEEQPPLSTTKERCEGLQIQHTLLSEQIERAHLRETDARILQNYFQEETNYFCHPPLASSPKAM